MELLTDASDVIDACDGAWYARTLLRGPRAAEAHGWHTGRSVGWCCREPAGGIRFVGFGSGRELRRLLDEAIAESGPELGEAVVAESALPGLIGDEQQPYELWNLRYAGDDVPLRPPSPKLLTRWQVDVESAPAEKTLSEIASLLERAGSISRVWPGSTEARRWYLIRDGEALVGCAADTSTSDDVTGPIGHFNAVAADPSLRRSGIALAVVARLAQDQVAEFGISTLAVRRTNSGGQRLYDRLGFSPGLVLATYPLHK